jgi:Sulfotransferase domain
LFQQRNVAAQGLGSAQKQVRRVARAAPSGGMQRRVPQFDFVVAGFPKCGTTSLLKTFAAHPDIDMAPQEQCIIAAPVLADNVVVQKLDATLKTMSSGMEADSGVKRAFKCPNAMFTYKSITRLEKHSPNAKLVVGVRHPVHMMQSFYNYRVTEIYERGLLGTEDIPDFLDLVSGGYEPWKLVSMASVRYELFLQQLGKTVVTPEDFTELSTMTEFGYELAVKPSNFTIFLYTVDQLEDMDSSRSEKLLADLQAYLGLESVIPSIGHENKNHFIGDAAHPESIVICEPQFADVRRELVQSGTRTANWLRNHFLQSPDVYVANLEHFLENLDTWSTDPCDEMDQEGTFEADDDNAEATKYDSVFDGPDIELTSDAESINSVDGQVAEAV